MAKNAMQSANKGAVKKTRLIDTQRFENPFYTIGFDAATCDYVCDGVADDVQFTEAIANASTSGVKRILVMEGTYLFDSEVDNNVLGLVIEGNSYSYYNSPVELKANSAIGYVIKLSAQQPGGLKNLYINGNSLATDGIQIGDTTYVTKMKGITMENVKSSYNTGYGLRCIGTIASGTFDDSTWYNVSFTYNAYGIDNWSTHTTLVGGIIGENSTCGIVGRISSHLRCFSTMFSNNDIDLGYIADNYVGLYAFYGCDFEGTDTQHFKRLTVPALSNSIGGVLYDNCSMDNAINPTTGYGWDFTNVSGDITFRDCKLPSSGSRRMLGSTTTYYHSENNHNLLEPYLIGNWALIDIKGSRVINKTTDYTLLYSDSNRMFTTSTNDVIFTLPLVEPGIIYTIINKTDGKKVTITPSGTDRFINLGAGVSIESGSQIGDGVRLRATDATYWVIESMTGQWNYPLGSVEIRTGAGAISPFTIQTNIVTTGTDAITLADGVEGTEKFILMTVDGGTGTLTPTNAYNFVSLTFNDVGDSAHLRFMNGKWVFIGGTAVGSFTVPGSDTDVLFNDGGALGADDNFTWNTANKTLSIKGGASANIEQILDQSDNIISYWDYTGKLWHNHDMQFGYTAGGVQTVVTFDAPSHTTVFDPTHRSVIARFDSSKGHDSVIARHDSSKGHDSVITRFHSYGGYMQIFPIKRWIVVEYTHDIYTTDGTVTDTYTSDGTVVDTYGGGDNSYHIHDGTYDTYLSDGAWYVSGLYDSSGSSLFGVDSNAIYFYDGSTGYSYIDASGIWTSSDDATTYAWLDPLVGLRLYSDTMMIQLGVAGDTGLERLDAGSLAVTNGASTLATFNALNLALTETGTGLAGSPTLRFGDGDTGLFEYSDDILGFSIGGSLYAFFSTTGMYAPTNYSPIVRFNQSGTYTYPIFSTYDDGDTGMATGSADTWSIIAGGVEGLRVTETAGAISAEVFGDLTVNTLHYTALDPDVASLALDNLASVAINTSLISDTDSTDDLGSSSIYWANAYIDKIYLDSDSTIEAADVDGWNALVSFPGYGAFANLTDYPADAAGVLTNDGAGNLSWGAGGGGGWELTGNSGTTPGTNFMGTTDDKDIVFKRNSATIGRLGLSNVIWGIEAIHNHTDYDGTWGVYVGYYSGYSATHADGNTMIGGFAGYSNVTGDRNVFLGLYAGFYLTGSDKFVVNNRDRGSSAADATDSLLYGVFDGTVTNQTLAINAQTSINGRLNQKQGADVASANNLSLGLDGNVFEITGTTEIQLISNVGWQNGSMVILLFTSTPTVKHSTATSSTNITILLAGATDFVASGGDTLTLMLCEIGGTQAWREIARAVI
jgi:hypothetical protein